MANQENLLTKEKERMTSMEMNQIEVFQQNNIVNEAASDMEVAKIYNDLEKAQAEFLAPIDEECLVDDTLDSAILTEIDKAKACGAFVPMHFLKLIYGGENTTKIFAKRVVRNGNRGEPVIVLAYVGGGVSPELQISMAELMRVSFGNYGEMEGGNKKDVIHAETLIRRIGDRILPYWEPDLGIGVIGLLKILSGSISSLAIDRGDELDVSVVYTSIYKYVQKEKYFKVYLERKGFYALLSEDMLEVASRMGITVPELIKLLKQYNLLRLQKSSIANQCEVKGVGSCYCIGMLLNFQPEKVEVFRENVRDEL